MKNLIQTFKTSFADPKTRMSFALTVIAILGLFLLIVPRKDDTATALAPTTSDDLIPEGFVLVPLDLQNRAALDALIGGFAVVDLFTVSIDGQTKGFRVGRRVKLVRSPQQPDQFAALVPEEQSTLLLAYPGPLFAVVQSRQTKNGSSLTSRNRPASRIRHFQEERK